MTSGAFILFGSFLKLFKEQLGWDSEFCWTSEYHPHWFFLYLRLLGTKKKKKSCSALTVKQLSNSAETNHSVTWKTFQERAYTEILLMIAQGWIQFSFHTSFPAFLLISYFQWSSGVSVWKWNLMATSTL